MLVAITGGNGDLGRAMQQRAPSGYRVRVIDQQPAAAQPGEDYRQADVLNLAALTDAIRGADAVIHLAAIRNPALAPPEVVFRVNVQGAYHVTLACEALGIRSLVYASSICYFGYLFRAQLTPPPYFPVDEDMPPHPEDSYSLSKRVGEEIMQAFVQRTGSAVANMRYAYLMAGGATGEPLSPNSARDMSGDVNSAKSWWTYVDLADAAAITWRALEYIRDRHDTHEAFNISADDTHALAPTPDLLRQYYPRVESRFEPSLDNSSHAALYSNAKARQLLGFQPTASTWRERARP